MSATTLDPNYLTYVNRIISLQLSTATSTENERRCDLASSERDNYVRTRRICRAPGTTSETFSRSVPPSHHPAPTHDDGRSQLCFAMMSIVCFLEGGGWGQDGQSELKHNLNNLTVHLLAPSRDFPENKNDQSLMIRGSIPSHNKFAVRCTILWNATRV